MDQRPPPDVAGMEQMAQYMAVAAPASDDDAAAGAGGAEGAGYMAVGTSASPEPEGAAYYEVGPSSEAPTSPGADSNPGYYEVGPASEAGTDGAREDYLDVSPAALSAGCRTTATRRILTAPPATHNSQPANLHAV